MGFRYARRGICSGSDWRGLALGWRVFGGADWGE